MKKNKIIWILNQTAGKSDSGWGERHFFLSKHWVDTGYEVKIISGTYNHLFTNQPKVENKIFTFEAVENGIDFCWVKTPKYNGTGFSKFFSNLVFTFRTFLLSSKTLGVPSVIIVSSMPIFPIVSGLFLKKKFKAQKLIIEIRDLWPLTPIHLKGYSKNHPLVKILGWFEKLAYTKSDKIVSLLPNAGGYINSISKTPDKFVYIPNGIDEKLVGKDLLDREIQNKIPKNKFIIGYAGTIGMANAMHVFIQAAIQLKENSTIHFIIVGDGLEKENLKNQANGLLNITFIDKIKKSQVQNMISKFDVCYISRFNSPLYKHGVSYNKYFDYMLGKKPILESSNYIKDQVELSGCGIIVPPEDPVKLCEALIDLKDQPSLELETLGIKGYDYVLKYHNYQYLSGLYQDLF
ncbi:glycosyltransferase family 4 protein [Flavicella sp.]|uniref:glycosyltransferase family 4 protein n=1 Tax=Flavicella sp. TaxID=2957742 RepID=UPI002634EE23|nr:glycosyltransferase family 4 protein [Flavicella sp.]MDG1804968.1 glycosyltransferase family 4 protein [Flavicella sp.]